MTANAPKLTIRAMSPYLGSDSDNVLTGDFTGDLRSGFREYQKSKAKWQQAEKSTHEVKINTNNKQTNYAPEN